MNSVQGIETLVAIRFVVAEEGSLTPTQFRAEIEAMLASGRIWVGALTQYWTASGLPIPGRQISRRALVSSWPELVAQVISLLDEEVEDVQPFGVGGVRSLVSGLLFRPFVSEGGASDVQPIGVDCVGVGEDLFLAYHHTKQNHYRGFCGSRSYTIRDGEVCYAD